MRKAIFATALIAATATAAMATQPHSPQEIAAHLFSKLDANADGFVSAEEYERSGFARFGGSFAALDADVDGAVSEQEYLDAFARHHAPGEEI